MEKTNCGETNDIIDRITTLPDVVQAHILSFLCTKEAVGTCVLSKGWKSTWAGVPGLDINLKEFRGRTYEERVAKFERFVKGVLQNREPSNIEQLKLVWSTEGCASYNSGALQRNILQAIKFKPRVLSLSVCKQTLFNFDTDPIFTCASLHDVVLEQNLVKSYVEISPHSVHIPCLKKLHLTRIIVNANIVDKIFYGCPILDEFLLHDCILNFNKISSGKLKKLVILDCCLEQSLKIYTPFLLQLEVRGCCRDILSLSWINMVPITFSWETMPSLINARIQFPALYYSDELADVGSKLLTSLSNITTLDLQLRDSQLRELLEKEVPNFPIFNNLKTLILGGWCMSSDFELVVYFLRSPNLQSLTLCNYEDSLKLLEWSGDESSEEEATGALFQREQLEIVKIKKVNDWWSIDGYHEPEYTDRLVNKLHAHVKTIGKIIITD
ncbi:F-box protein At4g22280-like [Carex rostrata]